MKSFITGFVGCVLVLIVFAAGILVGESWGKMKMDNELAEVKVKLADVQARITVIDSYEWEMLIPKSTYSRLWRINKKTGFVEYIRCKDKQGIEAFVSPSQEGGK